MDDQMHKVAIDRRLIERATQRVFAQNQASFSTRGLYKAIADDLGMQHDLFTTCDPPVSPGSPHGANARAVRWTQQSLKARGLLYRVERGRWALTSEGRRQLRRPARHMHLVAFSTDLGLAVWGDCRDVIQHIDEPITLCVTSPPYPIAKGRAYGQIDAREYVDWLCDVLAGTVQRLALGGNICLILGNDVFERGRPSREPYVERLTLALIDRFGLSLMDKLIWHNPSKAPGPVAWASKKRVQLNTAYETVLWLTNDPECVIADNRRVLSEHSARHQALLDAGGEFRNTTSQDGAHRLRAGASFASPTAGQIPRNVMRYGHACSDQRAYRQHAAELGLPIHGAVAPTSLYRFLIEFLSEPGDLTVDIMAGSLSLGIPAEQTGRRWLAIEKYGEYIAGGAQRFRAADGYELNPSFAKQMAPYL